MFKVTLGGTRVIVMTPKIVLKFPRKHHLAEGLLQNRTEWERRKESKHLVKLYFSFPFGLCNIMERINPLTEQSCGVEFIRDYFKSRVSSKEELKFLLEDCAVRNFGEKNGEILKLDWGGYGKCK